MDVREGFEKDGAPTEDAMVAVELADVIVDAIFGTGFTGAAKGAAAAAIELMNEAPAEVVSVDIASGVGADKGTVNGPAVQADVTVALHAPKVGHFVTPGGAYSGEVVVVPIGIPPLCDHEPDVWLLTRGRPAAADPAQGLARPQALGRDGARGRRVGRHDGRRAPGRHGGPARRRRPRALRPPRRAPAPRSRIPRSSR